MKTAIYFGWGGTPVSSEVESIIRRRFDVKFSRGFSYREEFDQNTLCSLRADFLFCFGPLIVRKLLLDSVRCAINFHTAPPKWPGRGSCSFALLDGDTEFGVTSHLVTEGIDEGPILQVNYFPIAASETVESLHAKTLAKIPELVEATIDGLERNSWVAKPTSQRWERKALRHRDLMARMEISDVADEGEVTRKIRAFAHSSKPGPYIQKHGIKFWYIKDEQGK